jgi:rfaE bifunctional protein kinase chain/domain
MNIPINRARLNQILAAAPTLAIGVVGDFTLDGYWYADMEQAMLSRETPIYPRPVVRETYSLGGAANTAWNLADLGVGRVVGFSVIGNDWRGKILLDLLASSHIETSGFFTQANRHTPFYGKVMLTAPGRHSQEDARLDFINTQPIAAEIESALINAIAASLDTLDGLIIADYQTIGVITDNVSLGLLRAAQQHSLTPIVVDSRERAAEFRQLILKPNDSEAARLFFPGRSLAGVSPAELEQAAIQHNQQWGQPIVITLGSSGCLVAVDGVCTAVPGVRVPAPVDTVGAGDAFLAAFTTAYAGGASAVEAACLANLAAAVTVTKIGVTGTATPTEITAMFERWQEQA